MGEAEQLPLLQAAVREEAEARRMTRRLQNAAGRSTPEWEGASSEAAIPPRVKVRIVERYNKRCAECGQPLGGRNGCEIDHIVALANGGAHRESNLRPLCIDCHKPKTAADRKVKAKGDRIIKRHFLGKKAKNPLPFGRRSKWKKKITGEIVPR